LPDAGETTTGLRSINPLEELCMRNLSMQYRLEQHPVEHAILPPILSGLDEVQVIEHDVEEITLPVPDWEAESVPIIH
jgi:hypothetical protein